MNTKPTSGYYREACNSLAPYYDPLVRVMGLCVGGERRIRQKIINHLELGLVYARQLECDPRIAVRAAEWDSRAYRGPGTLIGPVSMEKEQYLRQTRFLDFGSALIVRYATDAIPTWIRLATNRGLKHHVDL